MAHGKMTKFGVKPAGRPNSDINVTPLVDVVLVLLIIFMVVTPLLEKDILVRVPDTEQVDDPDVEPPPDQLVVSLTPEGDISINQDKVPEADYVPKLTRILNAKAEKLVFFMADDRTNYASLVHADGAKLAGATILGMMTELPDAAKPGAGPAVPGRP